MTGMDQSANSCGDQRIFGAKGAKRPSHPSANLVKINWNFTPSVTSRTLASFSIIFSPRILYSFRTVSENRDFLSTAITATNSQAKLEVQLIDLIIYFQVASSIVEWTRLQRDTNWIRQLTAERNAIECITVVPPLIFHLAKQSRRILFVL